ncbi:MAG: metallophosphoesterase family protein, partial [Candidatus Bipolaricaulia bacterium]
MASEIELLQEAGRHFAGEPRLIELRGERAVFVGDTHGDAEASERVIDRFLVPGTVVVFLGDYVDRGPRSRENILYLLKQKLEHPQDLFLLMGNHEGWAMAKFSPADFWLELGPEQERLYAETLRKLPLAATADGVIALHGALPDLSDLRDIDGIELGS